MYDKLGLQLSFKIPKPTTVSDGFLPELENWVLVQFHTDVQMMLFMVASL